MTINISGEIIPLSVAFENQNAVREAEKATADLYNSWKRRWPTRSDKEILAMVAYQFASFYHAMLRKLENAEAAISLADERLGKLLSGEDTAIEGTPS